MSVIEVTPERPYYSPISEDYESHLLARVHHQGEMCLSGIRAVLHDGAPMMEWAVKTESGIVYPELGKFRGHLVASEVVRLDLDPSDDITPDEILSLRRLENVDKLLWTPASLVYGVKQAAVAKLGYR